MENWQPLAATTHIGSMPHKDRDRAIELILKTTPEVPAWPQLSSFPPEQMTIQFLEGLPGIREEQGRLFMHTDVPGFEQELVQFYEGYLEIETGQRQIDDSRFGLGPDTGRTFFRFLDSLKKASHVLRAVKGQIVGPFTLLTTLKDRQDRALIYDEQVLDVVVKHLSLKAQWQIRRLGSYGRPVILFLDEPALAGYGSSAFLAISEELVQRILREVIEAIHQAGALAGTHICANTDWGLVFRTGVDIINFDAYNYFEKFALYRDPFLDFIQAGHFVTWGMIPTDNPETIRRETPRTLADLWLERIEQLVTPSISRSRILAQSLFSPSCGCGSLSEIDAEHVLQMTGELGSIMRSYVRQ